MTGSVAVYTEPSRLSQPRDADLAQSDRLAVLPVNGIRVANG